uniref:Uncharacterized protein n=1 Tax=Lepeophtheirus salmonis TaxID=72036 RepID=A0A0K2ULA0_LEPSM
MLEYVPHQMEDDKCLDTCETWNNKMTHLQLVAVAQKAYKTDGTTESKVVRCIEIQKICYHVYQASRQLVLQSICVFLPYLSPIEICCKDTRLSLCFGIKQRLAINAKLLPPHLRWHLMETKTVVLSAIVLESIITIYMADCYSR